VRVTLVAALAAAGVTLALLAPSTPWRVWTGDTAEAQTVPYILGIAHPTGFPAYVLLGWLWSHIVAVGTVAWRLNAFTLLCVALTSAGVVALAAFMECNIVAALVAALAFAFGSVVRSEAVLANAQALAALCAIWALAAAVLYARHGDRRALIAACACAGLGLATHPATLWVLPAIAVAALWQRRALTRRTAAIALLALGAPLLLYLYLPLRSTVVAAQHLDPTAAAPLFGAGSIDWDTNHPRTLDGFLTEVLGRDEHAGHALARTLNLNVIPVAAALWYSFASRQFGLWFLLVAAAGTVALAQRDRRALSVIAAGIIGGVAFASRYRRDEDLGWYLMLSFAATAALAAASTRLTLPGVKAAQASIGAAVVLVVVTLLGRADQPRTRNLMALPGGTGIIAAVVRDTPDRAIVVASWYEAAALGYGASVEHVLGSRTVVAGLPLQYVDRYPQWTRTRRVIVYAGGSELNALTFALPSSFHERPSSDPFYRVFEIVVPPTRAGSSRSL